MNRIAIAGLGCLLICFLPTPSTFAQDKTDTNATTDSPTTRGNGTVKFFNNSKGFGFISGDEGDQDAAEMTSRGNGTVKFFNETKGFGFISGDPGMAILLERIATACGGPVTGCTFEIIDILNTVLGNEVTANCLVRKRPTFQTRENQYTQTRKVLNQRAK